MVLQVSSFSGKGNNHDSLDLALPASVPPKELPRYHGQGSALHPILQLSWDSPRQADQPRKRCIFSEVLKALAFQSHKAKGAGFPGSKGRGKDLRTILLLLSCPYTEYLLYDSSMLTPARRVLRYPPLYVQRTTLKVSWRLVLLLGPHTVSSALGSCRTT